MYPTHRLETPPPASRFRRPWSPEPFNPNPRLSFDDIERSVRQDSQQRREGSDYSVEALDLADYTRSLAQPGNTQAQPLYQPYAAYPPSPQPFRSLSSRVSGSNPSLVSPSATSYTHTGSSSPYPTAPRAVHRPFSLPASTSHAQSVYGNIAPAGIHAPSQDHEPLRTPPPMPDDEIDIAQFPAFTRGWYSKSKGTYDPLSQYTPFQVDPFDPSFPTHEFGGYATPPPLYSSPNGSAYESQSARNSVPWGDDVPEGAPLDAAVKEERVRMLEREFAKKSGQPQGDEEDFVGSVDSKGRLITEGPKKRALVRWAEVLLALLAAGSSIYVAIAVKTPSPAPPASKPPAFILYGLSVITFIVSAYLFIIHPLCIGPRRRKDMGPQFTGGPAGMMVLPVQGAPDAKKKKKGDKKGSKGGDNVQVNLIVDPTMFNGGLNDDADDEDSESESTVPGSHSDHSRRSRRKRRVARRRNFMAGLALEEKWKYARKMLKWKMAVDVLMFFAWGAEFIYILIGKRCPSGQFDGWCTGYNVATAASCLLCFVFGFSIFFDIKDLHASSTSPRTRTTAKV